jgi:DNA-binding NarL/FixJ family response regulator
MQLMIPHILIVESDLAAAQVTSAMLARAVPTAIVSVESNFDAARRSVQSHPPDVLIVDPMFHRPESIWLVQQLKTKHPDAHVIVIASVPTPALRREMEHLGVDAYLEKPELLSLQLQQLLAVLRPVPPAQLATANMETRAVAASVVRGGAK